MIAFDLWSFPPAQNNFLLHSSSFALMGVPSPHPPFVLIHSLFGPAGNFVATTSLFLFFPFFLFWDNRIEVDKQM